MHHLPVVDETRLVGLLDDRHPAREWAVGPLSRSHRGIGELVGDPPAQVHPDLTLHEATRGEAADRRPWGDARRVPPRTVIDKN